MDIFGSGDVGEGIITTSLVPLNHKRFRCWWIALSPVTGVNGAVDTVVGDAMVISIASEVLLILLRVLLLLIIVEVAVVESGCESGVNPASGAALRRSVLCLGFENDSFGEEIPFKGVEDSVACSSILGCWKEWSKLLI